MELGCYAGELWCVPALHHVLQNAKISYFSTGNVHSCQKRCSSDPPVSGLHGIVICRNSVSALVRLIICPAVYWAPFLRVQVEVVEGILIRRVYRTMVREFRVKDTFNVAGRGVVALLDGKTGLGIGKPHVVSVRTPEGRVQRTEAFREVVSTSREQERSDEGILLMNLSKEDVPVGSTVSFEMKFMDIVPRESVVFAEDFSAMVAWYRDVLGFSIVLLKEEDYHYCSLENENGVRIGIADALEMGVVPGERRHNTVVLQFQVPDIKEFFEHLNVNGGAVTFGPSFDENDGFWFGGFHDLEGNPFWVVDENCP